MALYRSSSGEQRAVLAALTAEDVVARSDKRSGGSREETRSSGLPSGNYSELSATASADEKKGGKVRNLASKLENVLMAQDSGGSSGQWMMGRSVASTKLSRRASSSTSAVVEGHLGDGSSSRVPSRLQDTCFIDAPLAFSPFTSPTKAQQRDLSPSKPNTNRQASQSLYRLQAIYEEALAVHMHARDKWVRISRRWIRRRSTFNARVMSTPIALAQIDAFWAKFKMLMSSDYTNSATPGSMLSSVLVVLVEGRQAFMDLFDFGKAMGAKYKTIAANPLLAGILETLVRLERERDNLLYFVGQRRASRASATATMRKAVKAVGDIEPMDVSSTSPVVNAPLLLLRDRLALCPGGSDLSVLFPELHQIESAVATFSVQCYEEWATLLFEADTIGSAVMDIAQDPKRQRKHLYTTLSQVFVCARANALATISDVHNLSFVQ